MFFNFKKNDNNNLSICLAGICIKRFSFFTTHSNSNYVDVPAPSRPNKGCVHEQACISKFLKQPAIIGPSTRSCAVPRRRSPSWRSQEFKQRVITASTSFFSLSFFLLETFSEIHGFFFSFCFLYFVCCRWRSLQIMVFLTSRWT